MALSPDQIDKLVDKVVERLRGTEPAQAPRAPALVRGSQPGIHLDIDGAVSAAERAFQVWKETKIETRARCVAAIRKVCLERVEEIANEAVRETGLGRVVDKIAKNTVAIQKTPGLEILPTVAFSGDDGLTLHERAPFGVLLSVTPSTNPTVTIINNAISMIAGGHSVIFNVHPGAKSISRLVVGWLNEAVIANGGPA